MQRIGINSIALRQPSNGGPREIIYTWQFASELMRIHDVHRWAYDASFTGYVIKNGWLMACYDGQPRGAIGEIDDPTDPELARLPTAPVRSIDPVCEYCRRKD